MSNNSWISLLNNIPDLEDFIQKGMDILGIPGLSLTIIENNNVVFEKGYGVKKIGSNAPITTNTRMKIGSISKSMTAFMLGKLVDEKKFKWTDKVLELYPDLKLWSPELTKFVTVQDMISGSTGLERRDFPAILNYKASVFDQLFKMQPTSAPGQKFHYNNQLGTAIGYIAGHTIYPQKDILQAYQTIMQEKVFTPLGMPNTSFTPGLDYAQPHCKNRHNTTVPFRIEGDQFTDWQAPSCGIWSSTKDMARYIITELQDGITPEGTPVISPHNLKYRRTPHVALSTQAQYGYGWAVAGNNDFYHIFHNGTTYGFSSYICFFPHQKIGMMLMANLRLEDHVFLGFAEKVYELWTSNPVSNSLNRIQYAYVRQPLELKKDNRFMDKFLGIFYNDELGTFRIDKKNDIYTLSTNTYTSELMTVQEMHSHHKILQLTTPPLDNMQLIPDNHGNFSLYEKDYVYHFTRI